MYLDFYKMRKDAFSDEPSVEVFFDSKPHSSALEAITLWSRSAAPTLLVVGEKGSGKTLLSLKLADLVSNFDEPSCVYISAGSGLVTIESLIGQNPKTSRIRLSAENANDAACIWSEIGNHLGISDERGRSSYESIRDNLAAACAQRCLYIVVDDAQDLPASAVRQLEDLASLDAEGNPRLRLAMFFPPGAAILDPPPGNRPGASLCVVTLGALSREETSEYIYYRLCHSEAPGVPLFWEDALDAVYGVTGGNPVLINHICRRVLTAGAAMKATVLGSSLVLQENEPAPSTISGNETAERRTESGRADKADKKGSRKNIGLRVFVIFACAMLIAMLLALMLDFKRFFMFF